MNQVYVCSSYFHIYVSILRNIYRKDKSGQSLIILNDHTRGIELIIPALKEHGFFDHYLLVPLSRIDDRLRKGHIFSKFFRRDKRVVESVEKESEILSFHKFIQHSEINIFNNRGFAYTYFLLKYPKNYIRLLEDGLGNYYRLIGKFQAFKRKYILNTVLGAGLDPEVKEVLVQFPERVGENLKHKVQKLDIAGMQKNLNADVRNTIVRTFMNGFEVTVTDKKKLLLVTQPLEDGYMTEEFKVQLYNQVLEKYADHHVYLKPHPREVTQYRGRLNYDFALIPSAFPLEMFDLLDGLRFDVGVTICSSALYNLSCVDQKIILGMEYMTKPLPENWQELLLAKSN